MVKLVKREIKINIDLIALALIFPFLNLLTMRYDLTPQHYYLSFPYYSIFMVGLSLIGAMRQHNVGTESLFLSLPINRNDLLKSRYIAYGILTLIFNILLYIAISIASIYPRFQHVELNLNVIVFSSAITLIVLAILIPILYKVKRKHGIYTFGLVILSLTMRDIAEGVITYRQGDINFDLISIPLLIFSIIIYILSFHYSNKSFEKRWNGYDKAD